jgi:hypothetical protein
MGASNSKYVTDSYEWLCAAFPGTVSLMLYCCGAPAFWATEDEFHSRTLAEIKAKWSEEGRPVVVLACPTCMEMFRKHMPEIQILSLWALMAERIEHNYETKGRISVFDPCSSRYEPEIQKSIRKIVHRLGYEIEEIDSRGINPRCCGFGGLISASDAVLPSVIQSHNAALSDLEYVTYCTNCRDSFSICEKPSRHILDLIFDEDAPCLRQPPSLSERRENRRVLKTELANMLQDTEYIAKVKPYESICLIISDELTKELNRKLIHEDNLKQVIYHAVQFSECTYCEDDDLYAAYQTQGYITFWVRYRNAAEGYEIFEAYSHRMQIEE